VGNPVLALPMGFTANGMPLSVQLAGRPFDEAGLLRVGQCCSGAPTGTCASPNRSAPPKLVA